MTIRFLFRCGALFILLLSAACSSGGGSDLVNKCKWKPSSCMYEGSYEPGEREYAEAEAARLNKAESRRLRRSR